MPLEPKLTIFNTPPLNHGTLLVALGGWMDGGLVSTGTVKYLMRNRDLVKVAEIPPGGFYIDNFPGSMEIAAIFRPSVKYEGGLVTSYEEPENVFYADPKSNLAFFDGREPNMDWNGFADAMFRVVELLNVKRVMFIGSFGGSVPHTREPRVFGSVSHRTLLPLLSDYNIRPSDYEGPAHFATLLLSRAPRHRVEMISLAVEIPGYIQGANPLSIQAVVRRLAHMLNLTVDFDRLRKDSTEWEHRVTKEIAKDKDLAKTVRDMEEQYDNELIQSTELEES